MVRYVHPGEELAMRIKRGIRAADAANTASGTEKARTRDSTIISLLDEFAVTLSPTVEPVGGWSPTPPAWVAGEYVWKRTTTTYGDGSTAVGPALLATGNDGEPGAPGVGITGTVVSYAVSSSGTTAPSSGWGTSIPSVGAGQYLWTRTVTSYSSGSPTTAYSVGRMGQNGAAGAPGKGVSSTEVRYQLHSNGTTAPTGTWQTSPQTQTEALPYLWTRTVTTYTDATTSTAYSVGVRGAKGSDGATGATGVSVSSSTMFYWLGATQPAAPTVLTPPAPWTTTEPTYTPGTSSNLYVVVRTVLSSGAFSYSAVSLSASFAAAKSAFEKYTFSASAPVAGDGVGKPVGALWVRKSGAGEIIGYWEWSGSAWQERPLSQEIIPLITAEMIAAGAVTADKLDVNQIWAAEAWLTRLRAGVIEVDMLMPSVGASLNLTANESIRLVAGRIESQEQSMADVQAGVSAITAEQAELEARASASESAILVAQARADQVGASLAAHQAVFEVTPTGARVVSADALLAFEIKPTGASITQGGVPVSEWTAEGLIAARAVLGSAHVGAHQIVRNGANTDWKVI